jgi:hypothetical protein
MTGGELASIVAERWPGTRIVLASGYADLPSGSNLSCPRLSKPFTQLQLEHIVGQAMGS